MNYELATEIEIDAAPERVWSILTDFPRYPEWNPFVVKVDGDLRPDGDLAVEIKASKSRSMKIKPRIVQLEPGRTFAWFGKLLVPGLFDGEHRFEVVPVAPGKVRLVQAERFSGLLVPLLKRMLNTSTRRGFEAMNRAVKARAEQTPV